jgi:hypothetical protein
MNRIFLFVCLTALTCNLGLIPAAHATITVLDYYRLGESDPDATNGGSPTLTKDSVGPNDLTVAGSACWSTNVACPATAHTGSAFSLDFINGNSGAYTVGGVLTQATDNFGLEAWIKPMSADPNNYRCLAYNGNSAANGWGLYLLGDTVCALYGGITLSGSIEVPLNAWTHVALVCASGVATLYTNGIACSSQTITPAPPSGAFALGVQAQSLSAEFYDGYLDEVRVFTFAPGQFTPNDLLVNAAPQVVNATPVGSGAFQLNASFYTGATLTILATTNLTLPPTNWTVLGTSTEISPGQFQFTDPQASNLPDKFYLIRSP